MIVKKYKITIYTKSPVNGSSPLLVAAALPGIEEIEVRVALSPIDIKTLTDGGHVSQQATSYTVSGNTTLPISTDVMTNSKIAVVGFKWLWFNQKPCLITLNLIPTSGANVPLCTLYGGITEEVYLKLEIEKTYTDGISLFDIIGIEESVSFVTTIGSAGLFSGKLVSSHTGIAEPLPVTDAALVNPLPVTDAAITNPLPVTDSAITNPLPVTDAALLNPLPVIDANLVNPLPVDISSVYGVVGGPIDISGGLVASDVNIVSSITLPVQTQDPVNVAITDTGVLPTEVWDEYKSRVSSDPLQAGMRPQKIL